jgi:uncharacterized membrane protein YeaQ/YmgE (transglycosylase-associated protein family)
VSLLSILVLGAIAGAVVLLLAPSSSKLRFVYGAVLGIVGGLLTIFVGQAVGLFGPNQGAVVLISVLAGAVLLPLLWVYFTRRKTTSGSVQLPKEQPLADPSHDPPPRTASSSYPVATPSAQLSGAKQVATERPGRAAFDVFISYPHQDKTIADAACAKLEAQGIRCWIAPRDIVHGMDWGEAIVDAINGAKVMVLIFSGHANASPQIKREVERAVHRGIAIVPVRVENVTPTKSLEYFISTAHWLDAITPPLERHLKQLAVSVKTLMQLVRPGQESAGTAP